MSKTTSAIILNFFLFRDDFVKNIEGWKKIFDSKEPQKELLPQPFNEKFTDFQKMTVVRCLRPDKVSHGTHTVVFLNVNQNFTKRRIHKSYKPP